jgi:phenylacetate-coenzyme A ligase PaaK-like adenylate-forming protein
VTQKRESQLGLVLDARKALRRGSGGIETRQRQRFAEVVAFARLRSPYYRDLYRELPDDIDHDDLPPTNKQALMEQFDEWCTDRQITLDKVRALVDDPTRIAERFLGKYIVATTSGTTGIRGIFVLDDRTLAVTNAIAARMLSTWMTFGDLARIVLRGGRMAMVMATGGHFASAVAATRMRRGSPRRARRIGVFPADTPMPQLVEELNRFRPAVMAPYASIASLLATEQEAGRLQIRPVLLALSAEGLPASEYNRISQVFNAKVGNTYAATECTYLSIGCREGWLHVNADWVKLEPVDAELKPVSAGTQSHTVLITNLANYTQPIIRYDLGDSVIERPDRCPCGSPLPAIKVHGRAADVLTFPTERGESATIAPLAFGMVVERVSGIELFQIVQAAPTELRVRLRIASGADTARTSQSVRDAIHDLLARNGLGNVTVTSAEEPPEASAGGKYREVIPLERARP